MGAGLNLMLTTDFIRDSALMKKKRKFYNKEAEGMGGKIDIRLTVVKGFRIGPYRFRNVPTYVFDDIYNVTAYPYLGGLIGNDLLRRFNVVLNYPKGEIHLLPNTHYSDAFDYSYTGMELYYENGEIIIGDVARDSPAEKAGIKEGDVVLALNGNFHQNMQVYKAALQVAGGKIKLIISREGKLMDFTVPVKSILH
jgi:membrane-associated protease RseP (regulator of RpoE activity)